jgi:hypothetical protein
MQTRHSIFKANRCAVDLATVTLIWDGHMEILQFSQSAGPLLSFYRAEHSDKYTIWENGGTLLGSGAQCSINSTITCTSPDLDSPLVFSIEREK